MPSSTSKGKKRSRDSGHNSNDGGSTQPQGNQAKRPKTDTNGIDVCETLAELFGIENFMRDTKQSASIPSEMRSALERRQETLKARLRSAIPAREITVDHPEGTKVTYAAKLIHLEKRPEEPQALLDFREATWRELLYTPELMRIIHDTEYLKVNSLDVEFSAMMTKYTTCFERNVIRYSSIVVPETGKNPWMPIPEEHTDYQPLAQILSDARSLDLSKKSAVDELFWNITKFYDKKKPSENTNQDSEA